MVGSTLVRFPESEGADWHCEPAARMLRDERTCDWLAGVFDAVDEGATTSLHKD